MLRPLQLNGKNCYKVIKCEKLAANDQIDRGFIYFRKHLDPSGLHVPFRVYTNVYDPYFQTSSLKLFD